ncbi:MAG: glycosyltransferase family 4 protein [Acidobacteriota bacterium]
MRLLILGHSYVVDRNCATLRALAGLDSEILGGKNPGSEMKVRLLVPSSWPAGGIRGRRLRPTALRDEGFQRIPTATLGAPNQSALLYGPRMLRELRRFRPDVVQVEYGAKSLALAQVLVLRRLLRGRFRVVFFTWANVPYALRWPLRQLERFNLDGSDAAIVGNAAAGEILRDHGFRGPLLERPLMGVDPKPVPEATRRSWRERLGLDPALPTLVFAGRLHRQKGIDLLLTALDSLEDVPWQILLAVRGPELERVERWREASPVGKRLKWLGAVEPEAMAGLLSTADVLVLPSRSDAKFRTLTTRGWQEQFGMVLVEAMAQGVTVAASRSGAIPDVVEDAGLLFPPDAPAELAQALRRLLGDAALRRELAMRGRERVRNCYSTEAVARQHAAFLRQLLAAAGDLC